MQKMQKYEEEYNQALETAKINSMNRSRQVEAPR